VVYIYVALIVLAVNLLPAFGPPTWAILVFVKLHWHLNPALLVLLGCSAAVVGRYLLAKSAQRFQHFLPQRYVDNLNDARSLVIRRKASVITLVGIFVVSPLPSAQLFVTAGFLELPLLLVATAFFVGRLVSYSIYVSAATLASKQFANVIGDFFGSPWSIALQLVLLFVVCSLPLVNWRRFTGRTPGRTSTGQ
jgi:membrane protein YqaA with SNARE-associated domain